jgi:hypothetical protein
MKGEIPSASIQEPMVGQFSTFTDKPDPVYPLEVSLNLHLNVIFHISVQSQPNQRAGTFSNQLSQLLQCSTLSIYCRKSSRYIFNPGGQHRLGFNLNLVILVQTTQTPGARKNGKGIDCSNTYTGQRMFRSLQIIAQTDKGKTYSSEFLKKIHDPILVDSDSELFLRFLLPQSLLHDSSILSGTKRPSDVHTLRLLLQ